QNLIFRNVFINTENLLGTTQCQLESKEANTRKTRNSTLRPPDRPPGRTPVTALRTNPKERGRGRARGAHVTAESCALPSRAIRRHISLWRRPLIGWPLLLPGAWARFRSSRQSPLTDAGPPRHPGSGGGWSSVDSPGSHKCAAEGGGIHLSGPGAGGRRAVPRTCEP
ncbi:Hypothetical predicted protein, partial [Marmota monax]